MHKFAFAFGLMVKLMDHSRQACTWIPTEESVPLYELKGRVWEKCSDFVFLSSCDSTLECLLEPDTPHEGLRRHSCARLENNPVNVYESETRVGQVVDKHEICAVSYSEYNLSVNLMGLNLISQSCRNFHAMHIFHYRPRLWRTLVTPSSDGGATSQRA